MTQSLYIHIPFCRKKCIYCDFYSIPHDEALSSSYIDAVIAQLNRLTGSFSTIYIGGGTPTVLDKVLLGRLLSVLKRFAKDAAEFTIEANPESLSEDKLRLFLDNGVSRISIGVQSFKDKKLSKLGRVHAARRAREAVLLTQKKGFRNINVDLIYGVWDERLEEWREDIEETARLPVTHISCYGLTYEKRTPLFDAVKRGSIRPLDDDAAADMYEYAIERLSVRGFKQYEVSNFAKDGYSCRHNMNYWYNNSYIGIGASAVSYVDGSREKNIDDAAEYVKRVNTGTSLVVSKEKLSPLKSAKETAAIKIRTSEGIDFAWFKEMTGYDFTELEKSALKGLFEKDMVKYIKSKSAIKGICLRRKGFLFADTVSSAFL